MNEETEILGMDAVYGCRNSYLYEKCWAWKGPQFLYPPFAGVFAKRKRALKMKYRGEGLRSQAQVELQHSRYGSMFSEQVSPCIVLWKHRDKNCCFTPPPTPRKYSQRLLQSKNTFKALPLETGSHKQFLNSEELWKPETIAKSP